MDDQYIDELDKVDNNHFWLKAKKWYISRYIAEDHQLHIIDVGCGSGDLLTTCIENGHKVSGVDISNKALECCRRKGYFVYKADLNNRNVLSAFEQAPDVIIAFDLLEHLKNPTVFLKEIKSISKTSTKLLITVPAFKFLFSEWDIALNHYKRYSKNDFEKELNESGWDIQKITYIHYLPLVPAIIGRCILRPFYELFKTKKKERMVFYAPSKLVNAICSFIYLFEFACFSLGVSLPGLSIFAVATPREK